MDLNTLLLWIAGPCCLATMASAGRRSPRSLGWIFVCLVVLTAGCVAYKMKPENAGFITGGLWAMFVLAPALFQMSAARWSIRQDYDRAAVFATIAGILHPFDGVPQQTRFLRALALSERGETARAIALLQLLEMTAPLRTARVAALNARRLANDWPGLLNFVSTNIDQDTLLREPGLLPMYVRALGETGRLSEMLRFTHASRLPTHPQLSAYRNSCRLFAFAFCGQPSKVTELFAGSLSKLPESLHRFWIATAVGAAGLTAESIAQLDALEPIANPALRLAIQRRKQNPPATASTILTDVDRAVLEQLDRQQEHEQRFAHATTGRRLPRVTMVLIMVNITVFSLEWAMGATRGNWWLGGTMSETVLVRLGALEPDVLQTHEYYRLFMANFLHYGYAHIAMNMLALWILGPFVEFSLGRTLYAMLYLVSGVAVMVTVLFLQLHHWMEPEMLVGASGAIMAVIGATAAILLRGWYREQAATALNRLGAVGIMLVLQVTFDHFTPQVSGAAHIAGMVWGFVIASLIPHRRAIINNE